MENVPLLILPLIVGFISSQIGGNIKSMPKSKFQPPDLVFPIMWIILYILIGYSSYRVSKIQKIPLVYFIQLVLNFTWIIVYTRIGISLAFINIILLWCFVALCIISFYEIDKPASYLLIPYLLWVSYATFLNGSLL